MNRSKKILISGAVVIFIALFSIFLFNIFFQKNIPDDLSSGIAEEPDPAIEECKILDDPKERAQCEDGGIDAWISDKHNFAIKSGDPDNCNVIPDEEKHDLCVLAVALDLSNESICDRIHSEGVKGQCAYQFIINEKDFFKCNSLTKDIDREFCYSAAIQEARDSGGSLCPSLSGTDRDFCWQIHYTIDAVEQNDYDVCGKILTESGKTYCLNVMPPDSDKDKISDTAEITQYGTDPNNADTDGDGLTDGEEIRIYKTSALLRDTDNDGFSDFEEVESKNNPLR